MGVVAATGAAGGRGPNVYRPEDHVGLAYELAGRECGPGDDLGDLQGEALLAVVEAAGTYDPVKGAPSTHAWWRVRGRLTRARKKARAWWRLARRTHATAGPPSVTTFSVLGARTGRRPQDLAAYARRAEDPDAALDAAEAVAAVLRVMPNPRHREVLRLVLGEGWTHVEVAARWGVTKTRVGQVLAAAVAEFRRRAARACPRLLPGKSE